MIRHHLRQTLPEIVRRVPAVRAHLSETALKFAKGRDPREPGVHRKNRAEREMAEAITVHLQKQLRKIREYLNKRYSARKDIFIGGLLLSTAELEAAMYVYFLSAMHDGIDLFASSAPFMDYVTTKQRASQFARQMASEWILQFSAVTQELIRVSIDNFIRIPGTTIGDVIEQLLPEFGEARAWRIATTEITRAYAEANQLAGEDLKKEFPDVRVTKRWYTNNDDLVCPICAPLNGKEVEINEDFDEEISKPPAHVNCRCWIDNGTRI